ncbi:MAG: hypothetical protein HRO68_05940 [Nitrosopumilus sp.]|nr:hypothetical protein [Nitrosopumilus sp.]
MSEHDIVPATLKDTINYKVVAGIIGGIVLYNILTNFVFDEITADFSGYVLTMTVYFSVGVASLLVVKHHYGTIVFRKAYTALAIAYFSIFAAEVIYFVYDYILLLDPYPSPADPFYFALYPFTIIHLILNIKFFKPKIFNVEKIPYILFPTGIIAAYVILSLQELEEPNFDFWYGLIFVVDLQLLYLLLYLELEFSERDFWE